jgi:hypothetical protein
LKAIENRLTLSLDEKTSSICCSQLLLFSNRSFYRILNSLLFKSVLEIN